MAQKRLNFTEQDPFAESDEGYADAMRSHLSYSGTYEICDDRIIHHIELSSYPEFIGHKIERIVRLEDDILYQTTEEFFMHGESQIIHFVLQRVKACVTA